MSNGSYNSNNAAADAASFSYSGGYSVGSGGGAPESPTATLRRRTAEYNNNSAASAAADVPYNNNNNYNINNYNNNGPSSPTQKQRSGNVIKNLDFMFPKVDTEYTVKTERGGVASLVAYGLIAVLLLAECSSWVSQNYYLQNSTVEHITVDTSLGKKMRVNLDITFPSLACEDLHIDIMDVAGDSQLDLDDTMVKKRLNLKGQSLGQEEVVETNAHQQKQVEKEKVKLEDLPADYCGPCYGAHDQEDQCCNTCDQLLDAYKVKRWRTDLVVQTAEQCIREGRDKVEPKRMRRGEGCNLQGHFMVNRVGGNFHIAMGEGIERDGRHIHTFNPDDTHNFNASHTIHHLSFGPEVVTADNGIVGTAVTGSMGNNRKNQELTTLNGASKIVTKEHGTTGLFQYFIKIVPTTYVGSKSTIETNRYFYTERFRPLMKEIFDNDDDTLPDELLTLEKDKDGSRAAVHAGHVGGHAHHDHHNIKKNSVLPGVFFIYEIYPFEVEVSSTSVPFTHLLIRLMATVGGVFTMMRWADSFLYSRERRR